ncbi:MAG TPA: SMP-30/gluconolactonase/LRE family protein [Candidatus Binatia bacterium]
MQTRWLSSIMVIFAIFVLGSNFSSAWGDDDDGRPFPNSTFTTLITTPRALEGLTGDNHRNLYSGGSGVPPCPIWQINLNKPALIPVGVVVPATGNCGFSGIAFNEIGDLFVADGAAGNIYTFKPNANTPPTATVFASGAPGANGIAFDKKGNLWASDGTTGRGRVWKISGPGANCSSTAAATNCEEVFRIQPMSNEVNLDASGVGGVGRDIRDLAPGTITVTPTTRNAANQLGSQPIVANGLAFNKKGDLFNIDTARGALWKMEFDRDGNLKSPIGCDSTFTANTLCLSNVVVAHPILEGGDGIALDRAGNIWVAANERNAVAVVTKDGKVIEVFRNPVNLPQPVSLGVGLRNAGDQSVGNNRILEFPTSPFITGRVLCISQSDGDRRDNSPRSAGEVNAGATFDGKNLLGKISCMDQELKIPGLPLPIDD